MYICRSLDGHLRCREWEYVKTLRVLTLDCLLLHDMQDIVSSVIISLITKMWSSCIPFCWLNKVTMKVISKNAPMRKKKNLNKKIILCVSLFLFLVLQCPCDMHYPSCFSLFSHGGFTSLAVSILSSVNLMNISQNAELSFSLSLYSHTPTWIQLNVREYNRGLDLTLMDETKIH